MERGEWQKGDWTDQQRLQALAKYLPIFTAPGFKFSEDVPAKVEGGLIQMGWTSYGPEAQSFMQDAHDYGWVQSTNWTEWMQTEEAQSLSGTLSASRWRLLKSWQRFSPSVCVVTGSWKVLWPQTSVAVSSPALLSGLMS